MKLTVAAVNLEIRQELGHGASNVNAFAPSRVKKNPEVVLLVALHEVIPDLLGRALLLPRQDGAWGPFRSSPSGPPVSRVSFGRGDVLRGPGVEVIGPIRLCNRIARGINCAIYFALSLEH